MLISCPSGLTYESRKIRARELEALAEAADNDAPDGGLSALVNSCFLSVADTGPYSFVEAGDARPDWERILFGDVVAAIFALRIARADGDIYTFPVKCAGPGCRETYDTDVELSKMQVSKLSEESAERVRNGEPFEARMLDGKALRYRLQNMAQQRPMAKLLKQVASADPRAKFSIVNTFAAQTEWVEALGDRSKDIRVRWNWFRDLELDEIENIQRQYEAADCGIDMNILSRCPECRWKNETLLPLGKAFFLRPSKKQEEKTETKEETVPH